MDSSPHTEDRIKLVFNVKHIENNKVILKKANVDVRKKLLEYVPYFQAMFYSGFKERNYWNMSRTFKLCFILDLKKAKKRYSILIWK
ncbi:putative orfan [Tupanvirus soda lake]|uniref:Orfan n=2 Tax=Tupanvirus TaxID=2094720 RepID=A0AC62ACX0_9VIRU|nr:putative orfan [Tupanvirus soda lake]QKU35569.1 putative orfan [Tupanvirus soda lake]